MPEKALKIKLTTWYKGKEFSKAYDLMESRKNGQDAWRLAGKIVYEFLGQDVLGTRLVFDQKKSGMAFLLASFLANALIRGHFQIINGNIKLRLDVQVPVRLEGVTEEHVR